MCVGSKRNTKRPSQTEISQLEVSVAVNQQVLRLEVTVQDAVAVAVANAFHQLSHELLDHGIAQSHVLAQRRTFRQSLPTSTLAHRKSLHVFLQVKVEELEDEVELVAVGVHDVQQSDNVGVIHLLQQGDLPDSSAGNTFILGL